MGLFDSTTRTSQTQNTSGTSQPIGWQMPYINTGLQAAQGQLQSSTQNGPTNFTAQYTPDQLAAYDQMMRYGTNTGVADASAGAGGALTGAGAAGAGAGLSGLAGWQPTNTTGNVLGAASAYSQNPDVQGMIDASTRDARRAVSENVLPQIERNAQATGNINSNRTGISAGIVNRGLADTVADTSAAIRGGLYQKGLDLGQTQLAGNDTNRLGALGALTSGGTAAANAGVNANTGSVAQAGGLYNIAQGGITGQVAGAQAGLTNQLQQQQYPWQALQNYWNIAGQPLGQQTTGTGTSTGTSTQTPSTMQQIGAVAGAVGSAINPSGGLMQGLSGIFSDRRIKHDIKRVGRLDNGLPLYSFRYNFDPKTVHVGLMAQDVEKLHPNAVSEISGVKLVNYDLATA